MKLESARNSARPVPPVPHSEQLLNSGSRAADVRRESDPPPYEPPPCYEEDPVPPAGAAPSSLVQVQLSARGLIDGIAVLPEMDDEIPPPPPAAAELQLMYPREPQGGLPLALNLELEYCLAEFASGEAKKKSIETAGRFYALIREISHLPDQKSQLNAFDRIYHGLKTPSRKNKSDSKSFARALFREQLMPAIRRTQPQTPALQALKQELLGD